MPKISGVPEAQGRLTRLAGQEKVELVGRALYVGGDMIKAEASKLITEGAVSGKNHVPSRPGEPPNEETGHLRTQIEVVQVAPLHVEISSNASYSAALEYGTSKMAARPFMGPASRNKRQAVVDVVKRAVDVAVRKG